MSLIEGIKIRYLLIYISFSSFSIAYGEGVDKFCKDVPNWPKKAEIGGEKISEKLFEGVFKILSVEDAKKKYLQSSWVFIDARKSKDRKVGKIPHSLLITANAKSGAEDNQLADNARLLKTMNKLAKKGKIRGLKDSYKTVSEMKDINFVVFCNGRKCHRSTWGACELARLGIPNEQIHVMVDGFPGWQKAGFPIR